MAFLGRNRKVLAYSVRQGGSISLGVPWDLTAAASGTMRGCMERVGAE